MSLHTGLLFNQKIFNRNTVKISYSCMPNMKQIISSRNKVLLTSEKTESTTPTKDCNCKKNTTCPLEGKCLTKSVVYQATVTRHDNQMQETYVGLTENTFKIRYNGHNSNFKNKTQKNATALSQYIWTTKYNSVLYYIKWIVLAKCKPYSPACKRCNLCLMEIFFIICKPKLSSLNHRNELVSACRHRKKHLLCNN